ncbi:MAG: rhomboid family intramembrane serine protease [bacterium]|nr:rhomboid family intramembrane serine protease [bacterium]
MLLLVPYRIEAIRQHQPLANQAIVATTIAISLLALFVDESPLWSLVLQPGKLIGLPGHVLLHGGLGHLIGNMLFLWVFGNAICSNMSNWRYASIYLLLGMLAGLAHMAMDGTPAIGASGAINGVVGMALAAYPKDRVDVFWWVLIRFGTSSFPVWGLAATWLLFDLWGASTGGDEVAYWAHIGGLVAGVVVGLIALQSGWIQLTEFDKPSLLDGLRRSKPRS